MSSVFGFFENGFFVGEIWLWYSLPLAEFGVGNEETVEWIVVGKLIIIGGSVEECDCGVSPLLATES